MRFQALLVVALVLPFGLVTWGANVAADRAGGAAAASLAGFGRLAGALEAADAPPPWQEFAIAPVDVVSGDAPPAASLADSPRRKGPRGVAAPKAPLPRAIRVSRQAVLRLANAGVRPRGTPVKAEGQRPAGILLSGVSGLGIGLRDGDVLVEAAGRPALDVGAVVAAVIAARSARAPEVTGRFWRNGELWVLIVEQPYVQGPRPPNSSEKSRG